MTEPLWADIAVATLRELGSPASQVDVAKVPRLVKLCRPDRRLVQSGTGAVFQGGVVKEWLRFTEPYEIRIVDLAALRTPRKIVDHVGTLQVGAAQALVEKIEAHVVAEAYDVDRTRCITLRGWWLRSSWVTGRDGSLVTVWLDCVCAFGPWTPPEVADEPAIAGKVDS